MNIPMTNMKDFLTPAEWEAVTRKSDLHAWWIVLCQWVSFALIFVVVACWTNPLTILAGVMLLGNRHLGFGVLVHECGHRTFFRTPWLNAFTGRWLMSPLTFNNMDAYMRGHLGHHRHAGTREDPDLPNYQDYPVTPERFRRKVKRDLTGQTGWRTVKGIARGLLKLPQLPAESRAALLRGVAANLILLAVLVAYGHGWLYLMWVAAVVITNPFIARVRQVAEHGAVPDLFDPDPRKNTRTVPAGWLWRMIFCPHHVNYHLEHHLMASVPNYHLKKLHRILLARGYYEGVDFPKGYIDLLSRVLAPEPVTA